METLGNPSGPTSEVVATGKAKRYLAAAALLTGGLTVGAFLSPIGFAGAQSDDTSDGATTAETESEAEVESDPTTTEELDRPGRRGHRAGAGLDDVAALLGIEADELHERLHDGQSLAAVAEAEGVSTETLAAGLVDAMEARLDEAVTAGRIDQAKADEILEGAPARVEEMINRTPGEGAGLAERGHGRRGGHVRGLAAFDRAGLEELLGLSADDIRAGLADGQSLAEIAEAAGVSTDDLIAAIVESTEAHIDEGVEAGRLDADRAEELKAAIEERVTEMVNRTREDGGFGRHGRGRRGFGGPFGGGVAPDAEVQESSFTA